MSADEARNLLNSPAAQEALVTILVAMVRDIPAEFQDPSGHFQKIGELRAIGSLIHQNEPKTNE